MAAAFPVPDEFLNVLSWSDDMRRWPNVMYGDIYNYFISSKAVDGLEMKNFKSLDSYNYFQSGNVDCVFLGPCKDSDNVVLKGNVRASQTVSRVSEAFVLCQPDGTILKGWCTCMAGQGHSCSHVGAVLWKVEHAVRCNLTGVSCTDDTNQWNKGTKRNIEPKQLINIDFKKPRFDSDVLLVSSAKENVTTVRDTPFFYSVSDFKDAVKDSPLLPLFEIKGTALYKSYNCNPTGNDPVTPLNQQHGQHTVNLTSCQKCGIFYSKYVDINQEKICLLSKETVKQSENILWKDARKLRITASCAHKVPVKETTDPKKFVSEHLYPTFFGNSYTRHGIQSEICAKNYLRSEGFQLCDAGLCVSSAEKWLAASPDGIINNGILVEIKCPIVSAKWKNLDELIGSAKYDVVYNSTYGNYELKVNGSRGYFLQVQLTMFCCGLKKCKFVVWASSDDVKMFDINFDETYVTNVIDRLKQFYFKKLLPVLADEVEESRLRLSYDFKKMMKLS